MFTEINLVSGVAVMVFGVIYENRVALWKGTHKNDMWEINGSWSPTKAFIEYTWEYHDERDTIENLNEQLERCFNSLNECKAWRKAPQEVRDEITTKIMKAYESKRADLEKKEREWQDFLKNIKKNA